MPTLFIIILILVGCSVTLPGAGKGIEFLLKPDFSKVDGNVFLGAMGKRSSHSALEWDACVPMPPYFSKRHQPHPNGFQRRNHRHICRCTSRFYHLSCSVFGRNQPDAGPSLIFITLPNVFQQAFSGIPILAYIFSVMFYVLLALAALTSTISLHEVVTAYLHEEFNFTREKLPG